MQLTPKQLDLINKKKVVVLATADKRSKPRAILVEVNKAEADKLIITDNEMKITKKNILENNQVFVLAFAEDYSYCLKIEGEAEYHTKGKWFDFVSGLEENKKYHPKGAIVITVKSIKEA